MDTSVVGCFPPPPFRQVDGARALYMMRINQHGVNKGEGNVAQEGQSACANIGEGEEAVTRRDVSPGAITL